MLFLCDSIGSNVSVEALENATDSIVEKVNIGSDQNNLDETQSAALAKDKFEMLILQHGSDEITKLDTVHDPYFKN